MERRELIRSMMHSVDGASFITCTEVTRFLGLTNNTRVKKKYLIGLDRVGRGYFIPDVATRIHERMQEEKT